MDRAMGPFWPLWQFLEPIIYVLSTGGEEKSDGEQESDNGPQATYK
jgi:hypothetical protein